MRRKTNGRRRVRDFREKRIELPSFLLYPFSDSGRRRMIGAMGLLVAANSKGENENWEENEDEENRKEKEMVGFK